MGTSFSHYGVRESEREEFAQVPVRPPVIIETDSGMKRDVREDHYPGDKRNLHGHVRCRVEASGSARHVCQDEEGCRALPEAMGQAYNTKLHMRVQFLLI